MQIEEAYEIDIVRYRLVLSPFGEGFGLYGLEGAEASEALGAGVVGRALAVPFKAVATVEVEPTAEAQGRGLTALAPKSVVVPAVDVAVWVECGD